MDITLIKASSANCSDMYVALIICCFFLARVKGTQFVMFFYKYRKCVGLWVVCFIPADEAG